MDFFDIGYYTHLKIGIKPPGTNTFGLHGLSSLCQGLKFENVYKDKELTTSDWGATTLSIEQQQYAAHDAWYSLYLAIEAVKQAKLRAAQHK